MTTLEADFKIIYDPRKLKTKDADGNPTYHEQITLKYLNGKKIDGKGSKVFGLLAFTTLEGFDSSMKRAIDAAKKYMSEHKFD